jgi:predicted DNA-binding antitoxin AbrB/MazE fold protein
MKEPRVVEAVYENGVPKVAEPLPLAEGERVNVLVRVRTSHAHQSAGLIGFTGDPEVIRRIALDPEFSILESP